MKLLKKKQEITYVNHLYQDKAEAVFKRVRETVTPDVLAHLRRYLPYCLAADRQSLGGYVMKDPTKTGHESRVWDILNEAERRALNLPRPEENPAWPAPGELQYLFDRWFWYVDGEDQRSTGFSADPNAQPRFWEAYAVCRRLNEIAPDLKPQAVLVGEATRLARRDVWFKMWVEALQHMGIAVIVPGTGVLQGMALDFTAAFVRENSQRLIETRQKSMETMKRRGLLFNNNPPFGLVFTGKNGDRNSEQRSEVWTVPEEWNTWADMVDLFAGGKLRTYADALHWLKEEHGLERTVPFVQQVLRPIPPGRPSILEGIYTGYGSKVKPCKIMERDGLRWDYDITERGYRRYLIEYQEGVPFEIHLTPGSREIPRERFLAAQARLRRRGRPASGKGSDHHAQCIIPPRLHRCARCGYAIEERSPVGWPNSYRWRLYCRCIQGLVRDLTLTTAQARKHEKAQHTLRLEASVSLPLWHAIREWLEQEMAQPERAPVELAGSDEGRRLELERIEADALAQLADIEERHRKDPKRDHPLIKASFEKRRDEFMARYDEAHREACEIQARLLGNGEVSTTLEECKRAWRLARFMIERDVERKRELIVALVDQVVTDLDTGEWVATLKLGPDAGRALEGIAATEAGLPEPHETRDCAYCGAPITRPRGKFRGSADLTYCNKSCWSKAQHERRRGETEGASASRACLTEGEPNDCSWKCHESGEIHAAPSSI